MALTAARATSVAVMSAPVRSTASGDHWQDALPESPSAGR
jgi:hypothetical protein